MDNHTGRFIQNIRASIKPGRMDGPSERGGCLFVSVLPDDLTTACHACLTAGAAFDSAFVASAGGKPGKEFDVHYLFRAADIHRMVVISSRGSAFSALSSTLSAAIWDERKMQDLTGMRLDGIPDSRPLIFHPESGLPESHPVGGRAFRKPKNPHYAMQGTGAEGEFEVAVGPVHAGIIEPGHFRFHVSGERINKMEVRMFYLHRGMEKAAEGKRADAVMPLIEQISGDESAANSVAYCQAVEQALGISVPKRAEAIRAVLMELERIYSHLADIGGMATDIGFTLPASRFAVMREDMMRLNEAVTGNRFLRSQCVVGGVSADFDGNTAHIIAHALERLQHSIEPVGRMTFASSTFLDRTFQTGAISKDIVWELALVGPAARACGVHTDLRIMLPYSGYSKNAPNESVETGGGDVLSRFGVKFAEVEESIKLIKHILSELPQGALRAPVPKKASAIIGVGWSEAPRGGCTFLVELAGNGTIKRLAYRSSSFRNWRALEKAVERNIVPDFPLINKSFNLSYAGTDM